MAAANWSELPEELVSLVADELVCVDDFIRFGAVCKPWRRCFSILKDEQLFVPFIMLGKPENDDLPNTAGDDGEGKSIRTFIIPYGDKGQQDKMRSFDLELPKAQGRRCWGSPCGWVVTTGLDLHIQLLNPLTGVQIPLPSQTNLQQHASAFLPSSFTPERTIWEFTDKFSLGWYPYSSSSSQGQQLIVMAIFGRDHEVAFTITSIRPGNRIEPTSSSWTPIESSKGCKDVIFFKGQIFMIDGFGRLSVSDINQTPPKAIQIASCPEYSRPGRDKFYLVDVFGCLHLVTRIFEYFDSNSCYKTTCFHAYTFDFEKNEWDSIDEDLGDYALFVGYHTSFALSTTICPDFSRNSIYFTDDHKSISEYKDPYCDMGVFEYEEATIQYFDFSNHGAFSKFSRPSIFMPAL